MRALLAFSTALLLELCGLGSAVAATSIEFGTDGKPAEDDEKHAARLAEERGAFNLRVRYVKVDARWAGTVQLPLAVGDLLTPEKVSAAMNALRVVITTNSVQGFAWQSKGEIGVFYIDVEFDTNQPPMVSGRGGPPEPTVGVIFHPFYLHISLVQIGDNVLPIPRTAKPTIYDGVPTPLLALQPNVNVTYDRAFGTGIGGGISTDLLRLRQPSNVAGNSHLDFEAQGSKSLEELFYRADTGLRYYARQVDSVWFEKSLRAEFNALKEPEGEGEHVRNAGVLGAGVGLKLAPNTRLWADTGYRRATDTLNGEAALPNGHFEANEQPNRLLFEAIPPRVYGFFRASIWEDNGWQTGAGGPYQRFVGRIGYAKEIPVAPNQAVGLEIVAGGGKLWGDAPPSTQFFGGNSTAQFLYANGSSAALVNMPAGPLIRSFGESQAGFRTPGGVMGGDAFWHVNLNLSLPLPFRGWFRPLIPNETTDLPGPNGEPLTIKQVLSNQVTRTGPNMLAAALRAKDPTLSSEEAAAKAASILSEVEPAADYIINDANLYAIKPLLMFDAAGLSGGGAGSETWLSVGGGVQLTLVTAHLELGYMHTLIGPTFGKRGNIFVRLVFQNLF